MNVTGNGLRIIGDESGQDYDCHRARYAFARDILPAGSGVVDYGCGTGYGTKILSERHTAIGLEVDDDVARFGREHWGVQIVVGYVPDVPHDAVVCFEVLEHLHAHPAVTLGTLLDIAPIVVASVPFWERDNNNPHHRWFGLHEESFAPIRAKHHVGFYYQVSNGAISATASPAQNLLMVVRR